MEGGVPAPSEPFAASQASCTHGSQRRAHYKPVSECRAGHAGSGFHVFNTKPVP